MKQLKLLFPILTIFTFNSCQNYVTDCSGIEPATFIDNFYSYQSIADFEKEIKSNTDTIIILENSKLPDHDERPPFNIYTILVSGYQHLGMTGKLRASFFNDRLQTIWFYPEDSTEYLKQLHKQLDINLIYEKEIRRNLVKVFKWIDFKNDFYVGWADIRLEKEQNEWISKYS